MTCRFDWSRVSSSKFTRETNRISEYSTKLRLGRSAENIFLTLDAVINGFKMIEIMMVIMKRNRLVIILIVNKSYDYKIKCKLISF